MLSRMNAMRRGTHTYRNVQCNSTTPTPSRAPSPKAPVSATSFVTVQKRKVLEEKLKQLRSQLEVEDDAFNRYEMLQEIHKVRTTIAEIIADPLSNELCEEEPWAHECKLYD